MFCLFLWQLIQVFLWFRIIYYFASKGPLVLFLLIFHLLIGGYQRVSLVELCRYRLFLYFPSVTTILPLKQFLFHQDVCFIKMCEASHRKGVQELNLSPIRILFRKNKSNREFNLNAEAVMEYFFPQNFLLWFSLFLEAEAH